MDVATISMDPRIAAIHYKDYRKKVREGRARRTAAAKAEITEGNKKRVNAYKALSQMEKEDIIMMASYREMAKGARLLNVANVLSGSGLNRTQRLPVLALARANWVECFLVLEGPYLGFSETMWPRTSWKTERRFIEPKKVNHFSHDLFGAELTDEGWRKNNNFPRAQRQKCIVPTIPAYLRPDGDLSEYHILFEAKWEEAAPPDPILLRHVAGHMYSVLAQWDLTDIEKAVLEGRFA